MNVFIFIPRNKRQDGEGMEASFLLLLSWLEIAD